MWCSSSFLPRTYVGKPLELIKAAADEALEQEGPCRLHGGRGVCLTLGSQSRCCAATEEVIL